jgi:tripartite-type tricarboxylate transporter receptor subunit TctC
VDAYCYTRCSYTRILVAAAALAALGAPAGTRPAAAEYPERAVEITVTFAPGGTPDVLARALADGLAAALHQPFPVVNRLGAGSAIGAAFVSRAKPDGYSLLFAPALIASVLPVMQEDSGYTASSFAPICQTFESQMVLVVRPDSPFRTVGDVVAAARQKPDTINYGHAGTGSIPHLAMIELGNAAGVRFNSIPYRGDAEVVAPLLGQHLDVAPITLSSVPRDAVRIVGLFAQARNPALPEVPTVAEQGFAVAPSSFGGLFAPAGLPAELEARLAAACKSAAAAPLYLETARKALLSGDLYADSKAFAARLARDIADKKQVLKSLGYGR